MRRVREFLVLSTLVDALPPPRKLTLPPIAVREAIKVRGWHLTWEAAVALLRNGQEMSVAILDGDGSRAVIALFSKQRFELPSMDGSAKGGSRWRSYRVTELGELWCHLNNSDYAWEWVSGSESEVPFRLQYFEHRAELNPDGIVSRTRAMALELRDWIFGPSMRS